jgi:hypothetical protein
MKIHPYQNSSKESFWSSAVARSTTLVPELIYNRKWPISRDERIATAGSCFAQHIGRHMRARKFDVMDMEPSPRHLPVDQQARFGYSIYSARFGNIYTLRQLLQLAREAFGQWVPGEVAWEGENGAFYDALRPGVEPDGLGSPAEVLAHRKYHLERVREMFESMDLFIFTLGLTEGWVHRESGTVFPTAPGTVAGSYDPEIYEFRNFGFKEILEDLYAFRTLMREVRKNPGCPRFLLTVSPVPLTATASGQHVLLATVYSKSVLRAVAGQAVMDEADIDYFPSFEIISNPWSKVSFYEANLRSVSNSGVSQVMQTFFNAHLTAQEFAAQADSQLDAPPPAARDSGVEEPAEDVICEEVLLDAFGGTR